MSWMIAYKWGGGIQMKVCPQTVSMCLHCPHVVGIVWKTYLFMPAEPLLTCSLASAQTHTFNMSTYSSLKQTYRLIWHGEGGIQEYSKYESWVEGDSRETRDTGTRNSVPWAARKATFVVWKRERNCFVLELSSGIYRNTNLQKLKVALQYNKVFQGIVQRRTRWLLGISEWISEVGEWFVKIFKMPFNWKRQYSGNVHTKLW